MQRATGVSPGAAGRWTPEDRREYVRMVGGGVLWLLAFVVARVGLKNVEFGSTQAVLVALLPVPFFAVFLWTYIRGVRSGDELERRVQLEALAFAFPVTTMLLMVLGLLELAVELNPDDWSYRHVWVFMPFLYFAGLALARWRYR
ncbi:MAG TPA: hypothetical protein VF039_10855 [Longimicrobiales bacterium]